MVERKKVYIFGKRLELTLISASTADTFRFRVSTIVAIPHGTMDGKPPMGGGGGWFTYVRIPCDESLDVEELTAVALGYAGDALPNLVATRFASSTASSVPSSSESVSTTSHTDLVLAAAAEGRAETFALVHPSSANGNRGVYIYADEVGRLRNKPKNLRAAALAKLCGAALAGDFHGDVFVGAVVVSPTTTNVSFGLGQLDPGARWLKEAPGENAAYARAMRDFRTAVDAKQKNMSDAARFAIASDWQNGRLDVEKLSGNDVPSTTDTAMTCTDGLDTYFQSLADNKPVFVKKFENDPTRGNGLCLSRGVTKGETLWAEAPLVSAQTFENAKVTMACAWCHRSVGTIDAGLDLASGRVGSVFEAATQSMRQTDGVASGDGPNNAEDNLKKKSETTVSTLPGFEVCSEIPAITPCRHRVSRGCATLYCGDECLVQHARKGHDVACCGSGGTAFGAEPSTSTSTENEPAERLAVAAAAAFRRDCGHHDNLVLVTEIVGHIADRLVCGDDWLDATKQFRGLVGGPWWEVSGEQNHEMQKKLRSVAARSAALLRASSVAACSAADAEIFYRGRDGSDADAGIPGRDDDDDVIGDTPAAAAARASYATTKEIPAVLDKLGLPGFAHLLGICDLNQWSLRVDGPMRNVTRALLRLDENEGPDATRQTLDVLLPIALEAQIKRDEEDEVAGKPRWGGEDDEDENSRDDDDETQIRVDSTSDAEDLYDTGRRLFPMFTGSGLFSLVCLTNHSCVPNAVTRYSSWRGRTMVRIEALRDLLEGEELLVSYVDETETLSERTKALQSYGFVCQCAMCEKERSEGIGSSLTEEVD